MITRYLTLTLVTLMMTAGIADGQRRRPPSAPQPAATTSKSGNDVGRSAVVIDETLSVLRDKPSLFAASIQRMRRGRKVQVLDIAEADGVKFYKVTAPPRNFGWVQADAVFGTFRPGDEQRLAALIQAADGFDQIEVSIEFFKLYPDSRLRPAILLLYGDLLEQIAVKLSRDANSRLSRREMAASGAPLHSYFLNFVSLDRYRRLGVVFLFNSATRQYHYDGESWKEILKYHAATKEAVEAKNRLESLSEKMEKPAPKQ